MANQSPGEGIAISNSLNFNLYIFVGMRKDFLCTYYLI